MTQSSSGVTNRRISKLVMAAHNSLAKYHTKYVILRLSQYINDRKIASQMALEVLVSATMAMDDLRRLNQFGELADRAADLVGRDGGCNNAAQIPPNRQLITNENLRKVAAEINNLEPLMRRAIVFKYIEHLSLDMVAELVAMPKSYALKLIQQGRTQLKTTLAELKEGKNKYLSPVELQRWMDRLGQSLDGQ